MGRLKKELLKLQKDDVVSNYYATKKGKEEGRKQEVEGL